jgi:16S rRNA (uracil1498-N3)-methyltransferase
MADNRKSEPVSQKKKAGSCESCQFYDYDEYLDAYVCNQRLDQDEMHHAKSVMRLKEGESITLILDGELYASEFTLNGEFELKEKLPSTEASVRITLYQGIPKGDKMDYIVQKCTESGVHRIVPVSMPRCVSKWDNKDADKKVQRCQRIAHEAAKQSFRALCPEIGAPVTMKQLLSLIPRHELTLIPWEDQEGNGLKALYQRHGEFPRDIAIVIGPEGGMSADEVAQMTAAGAQCVTLGPRIFRTETAGLAAIIGIMALSGNMD